jgi:hypothetical protein
MPPYSPKRRNYTINDARNTSKNRPLPSVSNWFLFSEI